ncbi:MAG: T9SS type A sorting domain-containing protein [bacterium]|nr:T9SS type A sorting domain-containing protein [bacterium]
MKLKSILYIALILYTSTMFGQSFTLNWAIAGNGYSAGDLDNDQIGEIIIEPHPTISLTMDIYDGLTHNIKWSVNKNSDKEYLYSDFSSFNDFNGNGILDLVLITLGQFSGDDQLIRIVDPSTNETLFSSSNPSTASLTAYHYQNGIAIANINGGTSLEMVIRNRNDSLYIYNTNLTATNVFDNKTEFPMNFNLEQNFPNPFNPSTTIRYSISSPDLITIKIFDISGQLVNEVTKEHTTAGEYDIVWDGKNNFGKQVTSGMYFYQLISQGEIQSKKMILLK